MLLRPEPVTVAGKTWMKAPAMIAVPGFTHPDAPGLVVTTDIGGDGYSVTHVASGRAIPMRTVSISLEEAMRRALAVAPLTDWTRPMRALRATRGLAARCHAAIKGDL